MPDLSWTLPVAGWSSWSSASESPANIAFIDPMMRRRLSSLSRMALKVAGECVSAQAQAHSRVIFASRHGELRRTTSILRDIEAGRPVSPNAFSLSVLNAMSGIFGMVRHDRSAATAVSSGDETLGYALIEACAQRADDPVSPILLIYADEPADARYGVVEQEVRGGAFAMLIDESGPVQGRLVCSVTSHEGEQAQAPARRFATQDEALHRCLNAGESTAWAGSGGVWQWSRHVGTA